ncbi:nuclear protein localization protein 4 homolog isoform X3 [Aphidius gifuensis]|nr:nuclear protein localization protein 4 homolog isoform X3 [Aphidius gifuensis]
MSKLTQITLRVQSPDGTKRIDVDPNDTTFQLFEKVYETFDLSSFAFCLYKQRNRNDEIISSRSKSVSGCGLGHGDMVYLTPIDGSLLTSNSSSSTSLSSIEKKEPLSTESTPGVSRRNTSIGTAKIATNIIEDEVDQLLWKMDGKIQRKRDEKLCRHGANGCCVHCSPIEPFDEAYLKEQNVKHLSFHSYLRKLTAGVDKGKFLQLEDISCRIKRGCKDHPPWPRGICSKCQPNAITLNQQTYRHVDNVVFENANLVERFLNYWRSTGHQRLGYLLGRYEIHSDVPLGIRAVVTAIYEPPQESTKDGIVLLPDEREKIVDDLALKLNIKRVGWIFTDLIADDIQKGTVKHVRNIESHFLSAQECIMAGHNQNKYPNSCRFSKSGSFGSKFVTVCVTGDDKNQVHMEGYQVSNQCMALVRDGCLVPTKDAPELGYVIESTDKQYVPDVYYKEKDSYGNEVSRIARPLPVEYLLVDVPASTPLTPQYTFYSNDNIKPFPVENRLIDGQIQEFNAFSNYMQQFTPDEFLNAVSDFHLLLYISTMDMLPMMEHMDTLLDAIINNDNDKAKEWSKSEHWATVEQLITATSSSTSTNHTGSFGHNRSNSSSGIDVGPTNGNGSSNQPLWTCPHCTFLNPAELATCEMCSLPR